jgi:hypothetical protein
MRVEDRLIDAHYAEERSMRNPSSLLAILFSCWLSTGIASALTVDEIIKLKKAGVSDSTIELLIERGGDAHSAGVWRQDGWIVHTTSRRASSYEQVPYHYGYPVVVYPHVSVRRR